MDFIDIHKMKCLYPNIIHKIQQPWRWKVSRPVLLEYASLLSRIMQLASLTSNNPGLFFYIGIQVQPEGLICLYKKRKLLVCPCIFVRKPVQISPCKEEIVH